MKNTLKMNHFATSRRAVNFLTTESHFPACKPTATLLETTSETVRVPFPSGVILSSPACLEVDSCSTPCQAATSCLGGMRVGHAQSVVALGLDCHKIRDAIRNGEELN
jgi:hypothetical protein